MITSTMAKERVVANGRNASGFPEAFWLAKKDALRAWKSYPASGLYMLFLGVVAFPFVSVEFSNPFFANLIFLLAVFYLAVNAASRDYMLGIWQSDVFSHRLIFLRSLPVPAGSLVASRVMSMLFVLPFTVPAFFTPLFFFSDLGRLGTSYLWFCGIWIGGAVLYNGVTLLCELGLSGRAYVWLSSVIIVVIIGGLAALGLTSNFNLVVATASLAQNYGPLSAVASLLVGCAGLLALARLTTSRVERRELS